VTINFHFKTWTFLGLAMVLAIFGNLGNRKSRKISDLFSSDNLKTNYADTFLSWILHIVTVAIFGNGD